MLGGRRGRSGKHAQGQCGQGGSDRSTVTVLLRLRYLLCEAVMYV